jgi:molecular chaperone GrpE (heat shock protein)
MNDSTFEWKPSVEPSIDGDVLPPEDVPRFGVVDIVEAFTAMRHEWRGQTKESRALAELVETTAANLQSLESKLLACVADNRLDDSTESKQLALLIVETEHHFSRAATMISQWEAHQRLRETADARALEHYVSGMNPVARWFARPLLAFMAERHVAAGPAAIQPAIEGLDMVLARLRRMMRERGIERVDVAGEPFDANTMHAIGTAVAPDCPAGHVAEQLSPAYRWQGKILRFADVRVAK